MNSPRSNRKPTVSGAASASRTSARIRSPPRLQRGDKCRRGLLVEANGARWADDLARSAHRRRAAFRQPARARGHAPAATPSTACPGSGRRRERRCAAGAVRPGAGAALPCSRLRRPRRCSRRSGQAVAEGVAGDGLDRRVGIEPRACRRCAARALSPRCRSVPARSRAPPCSRCRSAPARRRRAAARRRRRHRPRRRLARSRPRGSARGARRPRSRRRRAPAPPRRRQEAPAARRSAAPGSRRPVRAARRPRPRSPPPTLRRGRAPRAPAGLRGRALRLSCERSRSRRSPRPAA